MTEEQVSKEWYVLRVFTGKEEQVKTFMQKEIKIANLQDAFGEILIPCERTIAMRDGKKREKQKVMFPGYLFVQMDVTRDVQHFILNAPRIIGFADFMGGSYSKKGNQVPQPLPTEEVARILGRSKDGQARVIVDVPFQVDEKVKINDGPFKDFVGSVKEINQEKRKLKVLVSIFGRITPVEVDILQVDSLSGK